MQKDTVVLICIVAVCLVVMSSGIYLAGGDLQLQQNKMDYQKEAISSQYPILAAAFHSPDVIIKTDDTRSFLAMAKQVNATVVYKTNIEGYVVVDNDFKFAYNLPIDNPTLNFGYFVIVFASIAIILGGLWFYAMFHDY